MTIFRNLRHSALVETFGFFHALPSSIEPTTVLVDRFFPGDTVLSMGVPTLRARDPMVIAALAS
jgi:hypothetical protein